MKQTRISTALLIITTFIWGLSFLVVQDSFASGWQPFAIIFVRSLLGALLCFAFSLKQTWWKHRQLWLDSMLCGVVYFMGFAFQSFGQLYSSIPNTAFITTLNVLFVPLILWVFVRKRPQRKVFYAVILALTGTAILSFQQTLQINKGDLFLILCAIGFA
jgi:drug/metabolite transporter (DMT)-like permease